MEPRRERLGRALLQAVERGTPATGGAGCGRFGFDRRGEEWGWGALERQTNPFPVKKFLRWQQRAENPWEIENKIVRAVF